jgi:hypothetical protein
MYRLGFGHMEIDVISGVNIFGVIDELSCGRLTPMRNSYQSEWGIWEIKGY